MSYLETVLPGDKINGLHVAITVGLTIPGAVAEVGVWKGGSLNLIANRFQGREIFGFDTFSDVCFDSVKAELAHHGGKLQLKKGCFPASAQGLEDRTFAFVHVDTDFGTATQDCLDWFWPRMSPGGVILFDDYEWDPCPSITGVITRFLEDNPETRTTRISRHQIMFHKDVKRANRTLPSRWFAHLGEIGDIIYSLPTIRHAGGGILCLYKTSIRGDHGMHQAKVDSIRSLLIEQEYVDDVFYSEQRLDGRLDKYHDYRGGNRNLADMHLATHGFDWRARNAPWLKADPKHVFDVIIHRSPRYHNHLFPWKEVLAKYRGRIGMIGMPTEHAAFEESFGKVPYVYTENLLEAAQVIQGSQWYIGNQSSPEAICEGLKHNKVLEMAPGECWSRCIFNRPGAIYAGDERVELPDLQ